MTLRDLAPVRVLAEERAREFLNALSGPAVTWEAMPDTPESRRIKERHVETHLRLLTDLSRPASMDALARLVAAKVGIECGATAPEFRQTTGSLGGWVLNGGKGVRSVHEFVTRAPHPARGNLPTRGVTLVPALLGVTDPAEALARVAIVVLA